ncbi:MAG: SRPBCC family protein [Nitrospiraceae bacterium]|nr:MAG: SRPBCC family protein [Nitrospiraceae bacterium]
MSQITQSIKINAPLPKVFNYVSNPENWTRYVTSLVDVRNMSDDTPSAGMTFDWTYRMLGVNNEGTGRITDFEKDKKIAMEMEGSFPIKETYSFKGDDTSTELTFEIKYDVPGKVLGVIADKLVVERLNVKEAVAVLNKIKDICEAV